MSVGPTFDLLLQGGRVIDPGSGTDGPRDVAIRNGKIAEVQVLMADQHNYDTFMWAGVPLKPLPDRLA